MIAERCALRLICGLKGVGCSPRSTFVVGQLPQHCATAETAKRQYYTTLVSFVTNKTDKNLPPGYGPAPRLRILFRDDEANAMSCRA